MKVQEFAGLEEWEHYRATHADELDAQYLALQRRKSGPLTWTGFCPVCNGPRRFLLPAAGLAPQDSFREHVHCEQCRSVSRHRAAIAVLQQALPATSKARIYITEQASTLFIALRQRIPGLVGSEFVRSFGQRWKLTAWLLSQGCRSLVRYQDVTALSFARACKDAILSFDVLEHVPDHRQALQEFARVLAPDGVLIFTVPFYVENAQSRVVARLLADGSVQTDGPPEYHGDPVGNGVLCFHHLGWDLLQALRDAGFAQAHALRVAGDEEGVPEPLWLLRARR